MGMTTPYYTYLTEQSPQIHILAKIKRILRSGVRSDVPLGSETSTSGVL